MRPLFRKFMGTFSTVHPHHGKGQYLSPLTFPGSVIYVHDENVHKYEKSIIQYLRTDIIGFDTEFVLELSEGSSNHVDGGKVPPRCQSLSDGSHNNGMLNSILSSTSPKRVDFIKEIKSKGFTAMSTEGKFLKRVQRRNYPPWSEKKTLCLIQLSSKNLCFVFNINKLKGKIPMCVKEIMEDEKIKKVCHDIRNDKDMFEDQDIQIRNTFDLYDFCMKNYLYPPSLQFLVKLFLKKNLEKHFRLSNWLSHDLKEEQILYAAADAYASREVYMVLKEMGKVNQSCGENQLCDLPSKGRTNVTSSVKDPHRITAIDKEENTSDAKKLYCETPQEGEIKNSVLSAGIQQCSNTQIVDETKRSTAAMHNSVTTIEQNDTKLRQNSTEMEKQTYEFFGRHEISTIHELKSKIHVKCAQLCNISFVEEMVFAGNGYKNRMSLQDLERGRSLIVLHSQGFDEEVKCCQEILSYMDIVA
ncbi:DNA binding protein, putative [Plasmodium knowlesi strain H]|uniref:3'-5' exonuclease n=3 Tax=Plasmodium knowlesi TaxID=5850 RepID=A0A5K1UKL0_PLAKH|nr:3'-5' exonuclease, putative [Plasmodium knowlesi strain H]OTN66257.1 putative DNA binding protein [Plasmodium knowlesi]CAA9986342.1 3'-5' exonuclease, putative [Plasmodium knowlesi strain H]SBO25589.1 DNA binding protein, putative [Plasmodium knowlesi strain H]SBO28326.1 DNA binding protein, putative [Plasmodium knowlesi strain H]VVS75816.1 3'-5' exonuclease, putative [Plasmodium knowlesi strain H]|eukprot:XP_002257747.1 dna binding protein, putative [Plasmodium knowlesi strain H]